MGWSQQIQQLFAPRWTVARVPDVDCTLLAEHGIQGVMLDLDNTLAPWRSQQIFPGVEAWIAGLKAAGLSACMVTNASTVCRVQPIADRLGIPWVTRAVKPLMSGFRRGMARMDTTPDTTAMIGDMLLTDVLGGNRLGLFTVLVEPASAEEAWIARAIQRPLERLIGRSLRDDAGACCAVCARG